MASVDELSKLNPDGTRLGQSSTDKISFYGVTPIVQRSLAAQAASVVSETSWISVTSNAAAFAAEVAATLTALGLWKGTA